MLTRACYELYIYIALCVLWCMAYTIGVSSAEQKKNIGFVMWCMPQTRVLKTTRFLSKLAGLGLGVIVILEAIAQMRWRLASVFSVPRDCVVGPTLGADVCLGKGPDIH